jgi:hypothetical protein
LAELSNPLTEDRVAALVAQTPEFFHQPDGTHAWIACQVVAKGGIIGIDLAAALCSWRRKPRGPLLPLLLVLGNDFGHGLPRQVQLMGNLTHRLLAVPTSDHFASQRVVHGR